MEVDRIVSNTIVDYFGLSDINDTLKLIKTGGGVLGKISSGVGKISSGAKAFKGKIPSSSSGPASGKKSTKAKVYDWATQPGPGKSKETFFNKLESIAKLLAKIFSFTFYIIFIPFMPWLWIFRRTRQRISNSYKKSLRPL